MSVNGIRSNPAIAKIVAQPIQKQVGPDAPRQQPVTDRLELSGMSHLMKTLKSNDVRMDKVSAVRAQLEAGTYEDDHKLNVAVDKLLDDLMA